MVSTLLLQYSKQLNQLPRISKTTSRVLKTLLFLAIYEEKPTTQFAIHRNIHTYYEHRRASKLKNTVTKGTSRCNKPQQYWPMLHWSAHMGWLSNAGPFSCLPPSRISQTCPPTPGSLHQEAPSQSGTEGLPMQSPKWTRQTLSPGIVIDPTRRA